MSYAEAMERFGSDKPDLRFGMELKDISTVASKCGFSVFKDAVSAGGAVKGIIVSGQAGMPRKKIDALVEFAKGYGAKGLAYMAVENGGGVKSSFSKFLNESDINEIIDIMGSKEGDLMLFAADKRAICAQVLGALRVELAKELGLLNDREYKFVWITEFPLFEFSEEENRY